MIKKLLIPALVFAVVSWSECFAQSPSLPKPANWGIEVFPIPIEFAPQIPYEGEEHLRFAPAWGETSSEEHWAYCFLWWIKGDSKVNVNNLTSNIQAYYTGLVGRNIVSRKIDSTLVIPVTTTFKKIPTEKGDDQTYEGTVKMLNYMSLKPITLNVTVHVMPCTKEEKLGVLFTISPQPKTHAIWKQFQSIHDGFRCTQ